MSSSASNPPASAQTPSEPSASAHISLSQASAVADRIPSEANAEGIDEAEENHQREDSWRQRYMAMKREKLRELCREYGLSVAGRKEQVAERLVRHYMEGLEETGNEGVSARERRCCFQVESPCLEGRDRKGPCAGE